MEHLGHFKKIRKKRERMQIKLGEGSWLLPDALLSSRCPKMGVPPAQCVSISAPSTSPSQEQSLGAEWKEFCPRAASRAQGMRHQTSDSFINNWDEISEEQPQGEASTDLHRDGSEDPFMGRNLHPLVTSQCELSRICHILWSGLRIPLKIPTKTNWKHLENCCPSLWMFLFRRSS